MNREGLSIARCTVERLMNRLGLQGVRRGKVVRTTISDIKAPCPLDRVNRQFKADRPNQLWVSGFIYVSTWQGWLYVAFVIDVNARRIVSWRVSNCLNPSDTSRRQKQRQTTTGISPVRPPWWRPRLNQPASTKAGAVQHLS